MFTAAEYRTKALAYDALTKTTASAEQSREFRRLAQSFTALADNEQWLADNHHNTVNAAPEADAGYAQERLTHAAEEHVLRCLGAALIMQWNTLPNKLRRELFDNAGAMGELLQTSTLRGQIARFLHKHKDDVVPSATAVHPGDINDPPRAAAPAANPAPAALIAPPAFL